MSQGSPYELDYYAWLNAQAALLRSGSLQGLDVEHLAEEVEAMGKSQRRELLARARILVAHLLKYRLQP
ncbi:MAG: DUF29 domain-containing protein, partial [Deltaproteobacteria bacterium]|nr:DUF29 domain-containing protein [Deltaproteobacteria bacterium]